MMDARRSETLVRQFIEPKASAGRVPPHDLDAEAAVLSAILLSRDALDRVLELLRPEHFYSDANGRIYEAAQQLALGGTPIDIVSVASWLRDRERLAQIGGASYLAQIADATPAVAHVGAHAGVVYEKWRLRKLIATCQKVAAEGYGDVGVVQEFIDGAEQAVYELARKASSKGALKPMGLIGQAVFTELDREARDGSRMSGISTCYEKLDAKTAGLHAGDLMIIAGRPGMGKTALAMGIAVNVAAPEIVDEPGPEGGPWIRVERRPGYGVAVFSLEMPEKQLYQRTVCAEARVDHSRLRHRFLQPEDWRRIVEARVFLDALPIFIDDTPAISLADLRAKVRRKRAEYDHPATPTTPRQQLGLVVIDYLQLMRADTPARSREQEISEISRGLKELAKEFAVPVIALSQLSRAVETRATKDKRPQLSDLRESGAIEQDADTVIFIYRDEVYNAETTNAKGIAEVIIAKQRSGPTGKVLMRFSAQCTRFDNIAAGSYPDPEDE